MIVRTISISLILYGVVLVYGQCVDKTNSNGVSDCPRLSNLCNNKTYYDLMTQQCPKTCNRCGTNTNTNTNTNVQNSNSNTNTVINTGTNTGTCADKTNSNGVSDCPRLASLCSNTTYYDLMTQQCPKTCNRCGTSTNTNTNNNVQNSNSNTNTAINTGTNNAGKNKLVLLKSIYTTIQLRLPAKTK